jgi:hypothetical protein
MNEFKAENNLEWIAGKSTKWGKSTLKSFIKKFSCRQNYRA